MGLQKSGTPQHKNKQGNVTYLIGFFCEIKEMMFVKCLEYTRHSKMITGILSQIEMKLYWCSNEIALLKYLAASNEEELLLVPGNEQQT